MSQLRILALLLFAAVSGWSTVGHALPLLSEVYYDAVGSDDGQSFVELHATPGTLLDGLTIEGVNGAGGAIGPVITLSGTVGADGLFVVADSLSAGGTLVADFDLLANFDFQNGPDSIVLRSGSEVLDAVGYGSFALGDVFAGEGSAAPDGPAGSSLAREFADIDTDDNAADFLVLATPTPGEADFALPEPGPGMLLGSGLAGLALLGRPRRPPLRRG